MQPATAPLRNGTSTHDQEGWSHVPPRGGQAVVEVVASYRGTVLDVQQLAAGRRSFSTTWITAGTLISVVGLGLFAHSVHAAHERSAVLATQVEGKPDQRGVERLEEDLRSAPRGFDFGALGAALALLGLVPLVAGWNLRGQPSRMRYTIGQAHGCSFPVALDSDDELPLVRLLGDDIIVAFTPDMTGTIDTSLGRETVAGLRARHRTSIPLRAGGQATFEAGDLQFTVRPTIREPLAASRRTIDRPALWSQVCSLAILGSLFVSVASAELHATIDLEALSHDEYTTMIVSKLEAPPVKTAVQRRVEDRVKQARQAPKPRQKPRTPKVQPQKPEPEVTPPVGPKLAKAIKKRRRGDSLGLDEARKSGILSVQEVWDETVTAMNATSEESRKVYRNIDDAELWTEVQSSPIDTSGGMILDLKSTGRGGGGDASGVVDVRRENLLASTGMGGNRAVGRHIGDERTKFKDFKPGYRSGDAREKLLQQHKPGPTVAVKSGDRKQSQIERVANNHAPALRTCQDRAKRLRTELSGTIEVAFAIATDGSVDDVDIVRNTTSARALGGCVARVVRKFRFGPGTASQVSYKMKVQ